MFAFGICDVRCGVSYQLPIEQSAPDHPGKHLHVFLEHTPPLRHGLHEVLLSHLSFVLSSQLQVVAGGHTSPGSQFSSQISVI